MVWQTIFCVLAACGMAMVIWAVFGGWLLPLRPKHGELMTLWRAAGDEATLRSTLEARSWLRESGLAPQTLVIWDVGLDAAARRCAETAARADPRIELVDGAKPVTAIWESTDGRRTDDPAGHRQRGGLSE